MPRALTHVLLALLAINTLWFVVYSADLGWRGLTQDLSDSVRVFHRDALATNLGIGLHMMAGAVLTVGAPLQAMPVLRRRLPGVHRRFGRVLAALAMATGAGGLVYIALQGTVGGPWMSVWFALYGAALVLAAARTVQFAIRREFERHFEWAARLVVLAVGSWIYRMHYALWEIATGGLGVREDFTGPFDRVQVVAFFVPYLLALECLLQIRKRRRGVPLTDASPGDASRTDEAPG